MDPSPNLLDGGAGCGGGGGGICTLSSSSKKNWPAPLLAAFDSGGCSISTLDNLPKKRKQLLSSIRYVQHQKTLVET